MATTFSQEKLPEVDPKITIYVKMIYQEVLPGKNSKEMGKRDREKEEAKQISDVKQNPMKGNQA